MKTLETKTDWGYYVVQIDEAPTALSLTAEFGFTKPPGLVQVKSPLDTPFNIQRIAGNACAVGWTAGENSAFVSSLFSDNSWTPLINLKVNVLDRGAQSVPVSVQLAHSLLTKALTLQFFVDEPGAQTWSWGLILS